MPQSQLATTEAANNEDVLTLLDSRRSVPAHSLVGPGPDDAQLRRMLTAALRVPDHGKLCPWRLIVLQGGVKDDLCDRLDVVAGEREDAMKARAGLKKLRVPPLAVVVVSTAAEGRIPVWEQVLSAGALCENILFATSAMGFGANWLTGWYSYDETARSLLGVSAAEKIAGVIMIGTPVEEAPERPRPAVDDVTRWPTALA